MTEIRTARWVLRVPIEADAGPLGDIFEHPDASKHVTISGSAQGFTVAWWNIAKMIGHWQMRGYGQWVVTDQATGEVLGRVGFYFPPEWPGVELGWIVKRDRWGNGIATEAAAAALEWAWAHTQIDHIISMVALDNLASVRIAEKIGLHLERMEDGQGQRLLVYGIYRPA